MRNRVRGGVQGAARGELISPTPPTAGSGAPGQSRPVNPAPSPFRSKTEAAYAGYLHTLMLAGDIQRYAYEQIRLNLAPKTTLTPDFLVIMKDGSLELHEVKGWARDDAMAKLKISARLFPQWKFWLVKRKRGAWDLRELPT